MSKAYKCDRCGVYYENDKDINTYYTIQKHGFHKVISDTGDCYNDWHIKDLDLCPACKAGLKIWLENV